MGIVYSGIQDQRGKFKYFFFLIYIKYIYFFSTLLIRVPDDPSKQTSNQGGSVRRF